MDLCGPLPSVPLFCFVQADRTSTWVTKLPDVVSYTMPCMVRVEKVPRVLAFTGSPVDLCVCLVSFCSPAENSTSLLLSQLGSRPEIRGNSEVNYHCQILPLVRADATPTPKHLGTGGRGVSYQLVNPELDRLGQRISVVRPGSVKVYTSIAMASA